LLGCIAFFAFVPAVHSQNFLFKEPRHGGFKIKKDDNFDFTNAQHFLGTGVLVVGLYKGIRATRQSHPKLTAALLATTIGLLKELEDGYREGVGVKDIIFNELGMFTFLFLADYTHYTLTLKQMVITPDEYGIGIRFFRTSDFTPFKASLGFYAIRDNHDRSWAGADTHFKLHRNLEFHFGASLVDLAQANRFQFRPNIGLAFRFF